MFSVCDDWGTAGPETEELLSGLFGTPKKFPSPKDNTTPVKGSKSSSGSTVLTKSNSKAGKPLKQPSIELTDVKPRPVPDVPSVGKKARLLRKQQERKQRKAEKRHTMQVAEGSRPATDSDNEPDEIVTGVGLNEQEVVKVPVIPKKKRKAAESYLEQAEKRMKGSRFRVLNERLYTSTGEEAMEFFQEDPDAFVEYHDGYREQFAAWPDKPVIEIINWLKKQPKHWKVADFGCGEAQLAAGIPQKCHSFDLCALNERVTVANMSNVPLPDDSVDVAVFCLSLMGTNVVDFLLEARRVLRIGGILKVAEVSSRIENVKQLIHKTERLGFSVQKRNHTASEGNYFTFLEFKKKTQQAATGDLPEIVLKPCIYKKR
ncbi:Ribosomal RNA-processing protein 8 [Hypsibius exemplaris]|uniref:Ribosomal RNA-processing protein 8 n=1 Tax=Hypsibius exemplaris TaxID=2072580 RepID=A0A1W0XBK8_HYPEX|nr:Ribosomal RNA-processing protein 8 [Hypsibius exemplaris]